MARVKYLPRKRGLEIGIQQFPNFSVTGSVIGMKESITAKTHCSFDVVRGSTM